MVWLGRLLALGLVFLAICAPVVVRADEADPRNEVVGQALRELLGQTPTANARPGPATPTAALPLRAPTRPPVTPVTPVSSLLPSEFLAGLPPASSPPTRTSTTKPLVALDPGHSPLDTGTAGYAADGTLVIERHLNLAVALRAADYLRAAGYPVFLTRTGDYDVNATGADLNGDGVLNFRDELQARIDLLNEANPALFISLHFNSSIDRSLRGTEVYYNPDRTFGEQNTRLALLVLEHLIAALQRAGYVDVPNRGIKLDTDFPGDDHFFMLGEANGYRIARGSNMPGVLAEALFLSNPIDVEWARQEHVLDALAQGYVAAIEQYFATAPGAP